MQLLTDYLGGVYNDEGQLLPQAVDISPVNKVICLLIFKENICL